MIVYQLPVKSKKKCKIKIKQHYVGVVQNIHLEIVRKLQNYFLGSPQTDYDNKTTDCLYWTSTYQTWLYRIAS